MNNIIKMFVRPLFSLIFSCQFLMGMDSYFTEHMSTPCIVDYACALPSMADTDTSLSTEERIVQFLCWFSCGLAYPEFGYGILAAKVRDCMEHGEPIKLFIVSFSAKSCNEDTKVIHAGMLDFAEYVGLFTLEYLCQQIRLIYQPGAKVTIYTDEVQTDYINMITQQKLGIDLFPEPERCAYQHYLATLVSRFPSLEIGTIKNIEECYAPVHYIFTRTEQVQTEQDLRSLEVYNAFWFHEFDCSRFKEAAFNKLGFISSKEHEKAQQMIAINKLLRETAHEVAQGFLIGEKVMQKVFKICMPDYGSFIRLDFHAPDDGNISSKLGISLVYGSPGTPWHGVIVVDRRRIRLMSIKDIHKKQERGHMYLQKSFEIAGIKLAYYVYTGYESRNGLDCYS